MPCVPLAYADNARHLLIKLTQSQSGSTVLRWEQLAWIVVFGFHEAFMGILRGEPRPGIGLARSGDQGERSV